MYTRKKVGTRNTKCPSAAEIDGREATLTARERDAAGEQIDCEDRTQTQVEPTRGQVVTKGDVQHCGRCDEPRRRRLARAGDEKLDSGEDENPFEIERDAYSRSEDGTTRFRQGRPVRERRVVNRHESHETDGVTQRNRWRAVAKKE